MNRIESYIIEKAKPYFVEYASEWDWLYDNYMNNSFDTFQDFIEDGVRYAVYQATQDNTRGWFSPLGRLKVNHIAEYMDVDLLREELMCLLDGLNDNEKFLYEHGDIEEYEPYELEGLA